MMKTTDAKTVAIGKQNHRGKITMVVVSSNLIGFM